MMMKFGIIWLFLAPVWFQLDNQPINCVIIEKSNANYILRDKPTTFIIGHKLYDYGNFDFKVSNARIDTTGSRGMYVVTTSSDKPIEFYLISKKYSDTLYRKTFNVVKNLGEIDSLLVPNKVDPCAFIIRADKEQLTLKEGKSTEFIYAANSEVTAVYCSSASVLPKFDKGKFIITPGSNATKVNLVMKSDSKTIYDISFFVEKP